MKKFFLIAFFSLWISTADAAPILDVHQMTTRQGIAVWYVPDHSLPIVSLSFAFRNAGSAYEPESKQGLTQMLSTMLDEGAGTYDAKQFQAALKDRAISLSFSASRDNFSGGLEMLKRHENFAADLLRLSLTKAHFAPDSMKRMQEANMASLRDSLSDPAWLAGRLMNKATFAGHPYAMANDGRLDSLQTVTADDLRDWVKTRFTRDNLVVSVSGDMDESEISRMVDKIFADLPEGTFFKDLADVPFPQAAQKAVPFVALPIPQTTVTMAWPAVGREDKDYFAQIVLNEIFGGGGFQSRLMDKVREKNGLTYGISSDILQLEHANRLLVQTGVKGSDVGVALDLVQSVVQALRTNPPTKDEVEQAKSYLTGSLVVGFSSTASVSGMLTAMQINHRPATWLENWKTGVSAVTPADVLRVAQRLFGTAPQISFAGSKPTTSYALSSLKPEDAF